MILDSAPTRVEIVEPEFNLCLNPLYTLMLTQNSMLHIMYGVNNLQDEEKDLHRYNQTTQKLNMKILAV